MKKKSQYKAVIGETKENDNQAHWNLTFQGGAVRWETLGTRVGDSLEHQPTVWPVPYTQVNNSSFLFPSASPRETLRLSRKQNSLFPLGPAIKCLMSEATVLRSYLKSIVLWFFQSETVSTNFVFIFCVFFFVRGVMIPVLLIKFQIPLLCTLSMALMVPRKSTTGSEQALPVVFIPPQDQMENLMALMNFLELLTTTLSFRTVAA